ncbi:asparagine synthase [Synechococcus phage S-SCSM1]|uniref:Asparagine synthase n=1 Tax=Synechococcus phage S-SCSM1 TaxID=2588487 RepID=A0A6M2ZHH4_9CAUD|nr:asparagine synthase [Synechococcus phage S-SCSM1]QFG06388.1 asparagine synthase [Synechococcus phage S-SCSM1]
MCSFLFTDLDVNDFEYTNHYMRFRGPDATNSIQVNEYTIAHNILSITGDFTPQPFVDHEDEIVCVYNGQIYNYSDFGEYKSDGECIIPTYKKFGERAFITLDGEFAIVLADFKNNLLHLVTDPFATKPLWYGINGGKIAVASYESAVKSLGIKATKLEANTILTLELDSKAHVNSIRTYDFVLHQFSESFDGWIKAFEESVRKRTRGIREKVFIGLSSGYDSGGIACELNKQNVPYKAYTVVGNEQQDVLRKRYEMFNENSCGVYLQDNRWAYKEYINKNVEEFKYRIYSSSSDYNEFNTRLQDDNGSCGLSMICDNARKEGHKIYLSGSGSDEIFSDYGFNGEKKFLHSNFGGLFPEDLETIFPWASFYGSTMVSYLAKEEYVAGSYGIETRYPYLDKYVVQEFLSLTHTLKNSKYKSVLDEYLTRSNYPFEKNIKRGF